MTADPDQLTLIHAGGRRQMATLIGTFTRENCEGWRDDANPAMTFHYFAAKLLLEIYPKSPRVVLIHSGGLLLYLREDGEVWRDKNDVGVKLMKSRTQNQESSSAPAPAAEPVAEVQQ